jgi:CheY-like chemotaxis protein
VEDNDDDRALFARAFANSGIEGHLHCVASASDAVMYLNRFGIFSAVHRPRLIIVDLSLPRVDGRQFIQMIRTNLQFKAIPVVVLTDSTSDKDRARCRDLGVEDYIVKPSRTDELTAVISTFKRWLTTAHAGHQAQPAVQ